jgi:signal transduction histidine kinase
MDDADQLREAVDAFSDGFVAIDADGLVSSWNPAATRITGLHPSDTIGTSFPFPTGTGERPAEFRIHDRWVEIIETALPSGGAVIELRDISHARALDSARTMFLASTSHELKTPLTAITGFAHWLQAHPEERVERSAAVNAIVASAEELTSLVEKILLSARTESTASDVVTEPTSVVPLLSAIAEQFAIPDTAHRLLVDVDDPTLVVSCDRRAMRTAIGQLVENAIKYSPHGGDVILRAQAVDAEHTAISIEDNGVGLAPGDPDYLFMAFYQGDRPIKGGVGLGLSIVRRLVEAQGGTVTATNNEGKGATFTMLMRPA